MPRPPTDACAACVGLDWADPTHEVCLQVAGARHRACSVRDHRPETLNEGVSPLRTRCKVPSMALGLARTTGPLVDALCPHACLVLLPGQPLPRARHRAALTPRPAQDDPADAARQRALC